MAGQLALAVDRPLATGTLAHPGELGAMLRAMGLELKVTFGAIQRRTDLRCVTVREMLREAAVLDASTPLLRGFLNRVAAAADVALKAQAPGRRMAKGAPRAARLHKQTFLALNKSIPIVDWSLFAINKIVNQTGLYADSLACREGLAAFPGKRQPVF